MAASDDCVTAAIALPVKAIPITSGTSGTSGTVLSIEGRAQPFTFLQLHDLFQQAGKAAARMNRSTTQEADEYAAAFIQKIKSHDYLRTRSKRIKDQQLETFLKQQASVKYVMDNVFAKVCVCRLCSGRGPRSRSQL